MRRSEVRAAAGYGRGSDVERGVIFRRAPSLYLDLSVLMGMTGLPSSSIAVTVATPRLSPSRGLVAPHELKDVAHGTAWVDGTMMCDSRLYMTNQPTQPGLG
jgi:hypothetical protein